MTELQLKDLNEKLKGHFVVIDENAYKGWHRFFGGNCFCIKGGETIKDFKHAERLIVKMLKLGIKRSDTIVAVGGGAVLDLVGFVASIYMRGVAWINVPTTLLSMADSSIGGKTAINAGGIKNIAGSFYPPKETIFCYEFLQSLDENEIKNGFCEIIKTALLDKKLFEMVDNDEDLKTIIRECVRVKREYAESDLYDKGKRQFLNLGHTIGHGIESVYGLPHGICVAIGLDLETKILGTAPKKLQAWIEQKTNKAIGQLPNFDIDIDKVARVMASDKKNKNGINFVCLEDVGICKMVELEKEEVVKRWKKIN